MNNTVKNVLYKLDGKIRDEISTRIELWSISNFPSFSDFGIDLNKNAEEMAKYHLEEADGVFFVNSNKNTSTPSQWIQLALRNIVKELK